MLVQRFMMKYFKSAPQLKAFQGEHLYIHHLDPTINILTYLLNHISTQKFILQFTFSLFFFFYKLLFFTFPSKVQK